MTGAIKVTLLFGPFHMVLVVNSLKGQYTGKYAKYIFENLISIVVMNVNHYQLMKSRTKMMNPGILMINIKP